MRLRITESRFFEKCYLEVTPTGVTFYRAALTGSKRRFSFSQIDAILMAPDGALSFQSAHQVFTLRTKPTNGKHQEVIEAFVSGVQRANAAVVGQAGEQPSDISKAQVANPP